MASEEQKCKKYNSPYAPFPLAASSSSSWCWPWKLCCQGQHVQIRSHGALTKNNSQSLASVWTPLSQQGAFCKIMSTSWSDWLVKAKVKLGRISLHTTPSVTFYQWEWVRPHQHVIFSVFQSQLSLSGLKPDYHLGFNINDDDYFSFKELESTFKGHNIEPWSGCTYTTVGTHCGGRAGGGLV